MNRRWSVYNDTLDMRARQASVVMRGLGWVCDCARHVCSRIDMHVLAGAWLAVLLISVLAWHLINRTRSVAVPVATARR